MLGQGNGVVDAHAGWREWTGGIGFARLHGGGRDFHCYAYFLTRLAATLRRSDVAGNEPSMRPLRGIARQLSKYSHLQFGNAALLWHTEGKC
jgi:hypothetical protein